MKNIKTIALDDSNRRSKERRTNYDRRNYIRFAQGEQLNDRRVYFDRRDKKALLKLEFV